MWFYLFSACPSPSHPVSPLPFSQGLWVPAGRSLSPITPRVTHQGISGYFSFPELLPWLLVGVCTSGWCKIPHSLCFCWTHSLVDFNLQSAPCLPDWKGKIFPGHSRGLIHFQQRPKLLYFPVGWAVGILCLDEFFKDWAALTAPGGSKATQDFKPIYKPDGWGRVVIPQTTHLSSERHKGHHSTRFFSSSCKKHLDLEKSDLAQRLKLAGPRTSAMGVFHKQG